MSPLSRILYVDDDEQNLMLFELMFAEHFEILTATSAQKGIEILRKQEISILISDQRMPEKTGIELFEETSEEFPDTIRILMTAYTDAEEIIEAINKGKIFQYITKPFNSAKLKVIIEHALEIYNLRTQNKELIRTLSKKNDQLEKMVIKIQEEEEKFRVFFNSSKDAVFLLNADGKFSEGNRETLKLFGLKRKELPQTTFFNIIPSAYHKNAFEYLENLNSKSVWETDILRSDNTTRLVEFNGRFISYAGKGAILIVSRDVTERKQFEKRLLQATIQTEEKERSRFAKDLHDGIGPLLSTAKLNTQWLLKPNSNADPHDLLLNIENTLDETVNCIREISNNLSPHVLNSFGLIPAVNSFIDRMSPLFQTKISFSVENEGWNELDELIEISLYRIICECLNNSLKHSNANRILVYLRNKGAFIRAGIKDDGIGFDVKKTLSHPKGLGLINMQSRINTLGGSVSINSKKNKGTEISIIINLDTPNEKAENISGRRSQSL